MKVILENELEKWAWDVMMSAHQKWEKNHGSVLQDQMNWYFEDLYKHVREKMVNQEVERRLRDKWNDVYGLLVEEYINQGLANWGEDRDKDEERAYEDELFEEYKIMQENIAYDRDGLTMEVEDELRECYYTFFNAPENLTVIYDGEVIQCEK